MMAVKERVGTSAQGRILVIDDEADIRESLETLLDFEGRRPLEIEPIWGEPLRRALAAGVSAPRLQMLYALLRAIDHARSTK